MPTFSPRLVHMDYTFILIKLHMKHEKNVSSKNGDILTPKGQFHTARDPCIIPDRCKSFWQGKACRNVPSGNPACDLERSASPAVWQASSVVPLMVTLRTADHDCIIWIIHLSFCRSSIVLKACATIQNEPESASAGLKGKYLPTHAQLGVHLSCCEYFCVRVYAAESRANNKTTSV